MIRRGRTAGRDADERKEVRAEARRESIDQQEGIGTGGRESSGREGRRGNIRTGGKGREAEK